MKTDFSVGVTGGIGSGKTVVCEIFRTLGIPVYDADYRSKYLSNHDPDLKNAIAGLLGDRSYDDTGSLNREWVASQVFGDEQKLGMLNDLIHPRVAEDYRQWRVRMSDAPYIIKEAALLFEAGSYKELLKIIVVTAPEELRIKRILKRDPHRSIEQIQDIMKRQWKEEVKLKKADHVIVNDGSRMILPQVLELHKIFLELALK